MNLFLAISSYFFATSLAKIIAPKLISVFKINLLDEAIVGVGRELSQIKTYDLIEFALTFSLAILIFLVNFWINRKNKNITYKKYLDNILLIASFIIFLQTHFVVHSGKIIIFTVFAVEVFYLVANKINHKFEKPKNPLIVVGNGIFIGFTFLLIANRATTNIAIPLILLTIIPIFYYIFASNHRVFKNPLHAVLFLSIFNPLNARFLFLLLSTTFVLIFLTRNLFKKIEKLKAFYSVLLIILFFYNPLYYTGNLDSIEEGFWLAWLQRLINKEVLYKDVAVYHPPLITWGIYIFTSLTDYTIKNTRHFLHLLETVGVIFFYFSAKNLLKRSTNIIVSLLLFVSLTLTPVQNNVEVRLTTGLIALVFFYKYFKTKDKKFLFWSGIITSISLMISLEVGLATFLAILLSIVIFSSKNIFNYLKGFILGLIPFTAYLFLTNSLRDFLKQISFYSGEFSKGYFNIELPRAIETAHLRFHIFWQHLSSPAWYWELARVIIFVSLSFVILKITKNLKSIRPLSENFTPKSLFAFSLSIFGLFLFRVALGRSDYHHLIFILPVTVLLFFYIAENATSSLKTNLLFTFTLVFVFFPKIVNENYLSHFFFKLTTYGEVVEEYNSYDLKRSGILVGKEINTTDLEKTVSFIKENTNKKDTIFVFPWNPETYFLADKQNATSTDTPYAFFSKKQQEGFVEELKNNNPKFIIYNEGARFDNLGPENLEVLNRYITNDYQLHEQFGTFKILTK